MLACLGARQDCQAIRRPSVRAFGSARVCSSARYRRLPIRDIDPIIAAARELLADVEVTQYQQCWPADDDGLWFFNLPGIEKDIQIESWTGDCPFVVEHSEMKTLPKPRPPIQSMKPSGRLSPI